MYKKTLIALVVAGVAGSAQAVVLKGQEITFNGTVSAASCETEVLQAGVSSTSIDLTTINVADLKSDAHSMYDEDFTIKVTCDGGYIDKDSVGLYLRDASNGWKDESNGILKAAWRFGPGGESTVDAQMCAEGVDADRGGCTPRPDGIGFALYDSDGEARKWTDMSAMQDPNVIVTNSMFGHMVDSSYMFDLSVGYAKADAKDKVLPGHYQAKVGYTVIYH